VRTLLLLTCCLLASVSLFAQNWRLFDHQREVYYGNSYGSVNEALRIDSFRVFGSDTVFYPSRRLAIDISFPCGNIVRKNSRFGSSITVDSAQEYRVALDAGDTFFIKTNTMVPWTAYTNAGTSWPSTAYVTSISIDTATVLGVLDSVRKISIQYEYPLGNLDTTDEVRIGKALGLLRVPRFLSQYLDPGFSSISGITNPDLGVQNLPKERFFSMLPGDTVQTYQYHYYGIQEQQYRTWTQDIYLNRTESVLGDTLFFQIDRWFYQEYIFINTYSGQQRDTIVDTIPIGTPIYSRLDRDFGEIVESDLNRSAWVNRWFEWEGLRMKPLNLPEIYTDPDSCFHCQAFGFEGPADRFFIDGIGGEFFHAEGFDDIFYKKPLFASIHHQHYGSYVDFSSFPTASPNPQGLPRFFISPNPAHDDFQIDLRPFEGQGKATLDILNLNGQVLQRYTLPVGAIETVSLAGLPSGIYFLRIETRQGIATQKLVVQ
jgi:hypothetical protein